MLNAKETAEWSLVNKSVHKRFRERLETDIQHLFANFFYDTLWIAIDTNTAEVFLYCKLEDPFGVEFLVCFSY